MKFFDRDADDIRSVSLKLVFEEKRFEGIPYTGNRWRMYKPMLEPGKAYAACIRFFIKPWPTRMESWR